jgi:hypothetical protein
LRGASGGRRAALAGGITRFAPPAGRNGRSLGALEEVPGQPGKRTLSELTGLVKTRLRGMQYRPDLLAAFLARTRLDLALLRNTRN